MIPKIFVNHINKKIKNNMEEYHFTKDNIDNEIIDVSDINSKLNDIFSSTSFVYKANVDLYLKDGSILNEDIIAVKDKSVITLNNKKIPINDILDIRKV